MIARDSCAPAPGQRRGARLLADQLGALDPLRVDLRDLVGVLGVQLVAARRRSASAPPPARAPPTPSNAVERGTTRSASATASGCRWREIRCLIASTINPRNLGSTGGSP